MRKPETIETLYLDFDGFFASVMQQAMPHLRGKPVGVIPFDTASAQYTTVIACSKEAKARGVQNVMRVPEARAICPDIVLVMQRPDLFRWAHGALLNEISCEIPIETVKSIDELCCTLTKSDIGDPQGLARRLKSFIAENIGPHITCSIGYAANRLLAKMACKMDKPNGVTIWRPEDMPRPLQDLPLTEVPGIGGRMEKRLAAAGVNQMEGLLDLQPKQARALWGNVTGERLWYALHGYALKAEPTGRGMYGHGRVLPPEWRNLDKAYDCARLLLIKAARRMRRDRFYTNRLWVWLDLRKGAWVQCRDIPSAHDDKAILSALDILWEKARDDLARHKIEIVRVGVTLSDLTPANARKRDLFHADDEDRQKWERLTADMDGLNRKFGKRVLSLGPLTPPPGGYAGGKIAYTRIPSAEDFW
ncbi:UMUC-like DNA-repair protein [Parvularcula bermudensis HTCC2503]|uniref:DNA-directed DNA polymerase n=1 Tax=Parvularcula bermudensis (strain ATCC BAA-594 / HTCC2503 / KCTC 12087) TaxID=314260 RepID=E0TDM0_PARBH|nr:type VI secretion protein ImpB [Parvularcula bermudensis]ADM08775.1 UMUC-like DNA-repair protein [Parvularcula bermudensis HTCC2503]